MTGKQTSLDTPESWRDLSATRLSLVGRLHDWEDQHSWQRFYEKYNRLLFLWATKAGLSDAESEEALQNMVISIAKSMKDGQFKSRGKGSFKAWLYGVARHRILDQFRSRSAAAKETELLKENTTPADAELERLWDSEWASHKLRMAASMTRERVNAVQFQIFDLYVLRLWSVNEVMKTLNVSRAQVYMAKLRVGSVFKDMLAQADE
jgi:RNA polymerase sigma factor (sigma-70 family)